MSMDVPTLLEAMAERIATIPNVLGAWHEPPNTPPASKLPGVVMFWDGSMPTEIQASNMTGGTLWIAQIKAQILLPRKGDTPQEFVKSRALITPIVDAFAMPVRECLPNLTGHVDRVTPVRAHGDLLIPYAGALYMGAEVYFEAKFHRRRTQ